MEDKSIQLFDRDNVTNESLLLRGSKWGKLSSANINLFEQKTSVLLPKLGSYFITYGNARWQMLLRKEVFLPEDESERNPVLLELIYQQVLHDLYSRTCCRLSPKDRAQLSQVLESTENSYDEITSRTTEELLVKKAKEFDFYFARIFPITGYITSSQVQTFVAVSHSGIRFAIRSRLDEELKCHSHINYNEVIQVKSFKEKLTIDTFSRKIALHSALAFSIKKLIDVYLKKHKKAEFYVHSICDFNTNEEEGFLSFRRGDIIRILEKHDLEEGWLYGFVHDKRGKFPANYVEEYHPTLMLQSSKPDNRVWAKPIGSMIFDDVQSDTSSLDSTATSDEGKFSMLEFAFQYFRQEDPKSSQRKKGVENWTWKSMTDLIKFSEEPLQNSLLNYNNKQLNRTAVEISKAIWKFMGDCTKVKHQSEAELLLFILKTGKEILDLRDEIYCQLTKQTTNNKSNNRDSLSRGWRLLMICTAYFDCSQWLKPYLMKYLKLANNPKRDIQGAAAVSEQNLIRSLKYGGRKHYPSENELRMLLQGRHTKQQVVILPGNLKCMIRIDTSTTGADAISDVCREMGLEHEEEIAEYGIFTYLEEQKLLLSLQKGDYIFDVFFELEKQNIRFSLAFRKVIWYEQVKFNDALLVEVLYNQVLPDVMNGYLLHIRESHEKLMVSSDSIALLVALQYKISGGKSVPSLREIQQLMPVIALNMLSPSQWTVKVHESLNSIFRFNAFSARKRFLEIISTWPYFGSSFFFIKHSSHPNVQSESILAINKRGVSFLNTTTEETLVSFSYDEVLSTRNLRTETGRLFLDLKCGNLMIQRVTRLETPRGKEISNLIGQYINKMTEEEKRNDMLNGALKPQNITTATTQL